MKYQNIDHYSELDQLVHHNTVLQFYFLRIHTFLHHKKHRGPNNSLPLQHRGCLGDMRCRAYIQHYKYLDHIQFVYLIRTVHTLNNVKFL